MGHCRRGGLIRPWAVEGGRPRPPGARGHDGRALGLVWRFDRSVIFRATMGGVAVEGDRRVRVAMTDVRWGLLGNRSDTEDLIRRE